MDRDSNRRTGTPRPQRRVDWDAIEKAGMTVNERRKRAAASITEKTGIETTVTRAKSGPSRIQIAQATLRVMGIR